MKFILQRSLITILILCSVFVAKAQIGAGDLLFTGINTYDDNTDGKTQNDVFSFVMLKSCPPNTVIYFTDLGYTAGAFQSLLCGTGMGSQTDGVIQWTSPGTRLAPGTQVVISCKYNPAANIGSATGLYATNKTAGLTNPSLKTYVSLGLVGDQLFAYTNNNAGNPASYSTILAGLNVNRKLWDAANNISSCELTSSRSEMPIESGPLKFPSAFAVNAKYNCATLVGTSSSLRKLLQDTTNWYKNNTYSTTFPDTFNLVKTAPCNLVVVNPDANGVVRVDGSTTNPGDGTSWQEPVKELRDALLVAADPANNIKQIWVAKGTYLPSGTGDASKSFVIPANVSVYGGFQPGGAGEASPAARTAPAANMAVLSGDLDNNDNNKSNGITLTGSDIVGANSTTVVVFGNPSTGIKLDYIVITGGNNSTGLGAGFVSGVTASIVGADFTNVQIVGNRAINAPGIYLPYANGSNITFTNVLVAGNTCITPGNYAIRSGNNYLTFRQTTIAGNTGGLNMVGGNGSLSVYNSIIAKNTNNDLTQSIGTITYVNSMIGGSFYTSASTTDATAAGVTFKSPATGDYSLDVTSKVINRGNNSVVGGMTLDLAGKPRISNVTVDPGAYEYQAVAPTLTFPAITNTITYGDANVTLAPGPSTNSDGVITITSANPAIASVTNNLLTAKGAGGPVTLTATVSATNAFLAASTTTTVSVARKSIDLKPDDVTRMYGQPNPAGTYAYSGFVSPDDATVFTGTPVITFGASQTDRPGTYDINIDAAAVTSANYTIVPQKGTLTIIPATQNINVPTGVTKTYGDAPFDPGAVATSGLAITYEIISGAATANGNTITLTGAGTVNVRATQSGNEYYPAATPVTFVIQVAQATAIVTAKDTSVTYGSTTPAFIYQITNLVAPGDITGITGTPVLTTDAPANAPAGSYTVDITAGTLSSANYIFSLKPGTYTVTKANQTISLTTIPDKIYGDAPFDLQATVTSGLPLTYTVAGGPISITGNLVTIQGAGSASVTVNQAGNNNYNPVTYTQSFQINAAELTVVAEDKSSAYGETIVPLTYHYNGLVYNESPAVLGGIPALATTATSASDAGNYPIVVNIGALNNSNYNIHAQTGSYTIGTTTQTITFNKPADVTYGDAPFTLTGTSSSGLPVVYTIVSGPATIANDVLTITGAGDVLISAGQPGNNNYQAATAVTQTLTIRKAVLNVTADDKTRAYHETEPTFTYAISGYKYSDDETIVTGVANLTTTADLLSAPGTYDINVATGSLSAANYTFNLVKGALHIVKATQSINFPAIGDKTYGDPAFTPAINASSSLPVILSATGPVTVNNNVLSITGTGTVTVTATQAGDANYLPAVTTQTFDIKKATLRVIADDKQKNYMEPVEALTYHFDGFVYNETAAVVSGAAVGSTSVNISSPLGTYPIYMAQQSLAAANYDFEMVPGSYTVGKGNQVITFTQPADMTYGATPFQLAPTSNSSLPVAYRILSGPATLSGNVISLTGAGDVTIEAYQDGNSSWNAATPVTRTFNVAKATVDIFVGNYYRTYLQGDPTFTFFISGLVNNDQPTVISGAPVITPASTHTSDVGVYDVNVGIGTLQAANYNFNLVHGTLTISQSNQGINFAPLNNRTYGDPALVLTTPTSSGLPVSYSVSGPATVNGNTITLTGTGTVTVTATQEGDRNWLAATPRQQSFTVLPAVLTVVADDKQKIYQLLNPVFTYKIKGFVYNDDAAVVRGTPILSTIADNNSVVGTYPIDVALNTLAADNYTFVTVAGTLTVVPNAQTISFQQPADKTYGDAPFALVANSSSTLPVSFRIVSGPATVTGNMVTITGAGPVVVVAEQAGNANFDPATAVQATIKVQKAPVTVTAHNAEKTYDGQPYTGGNGADYTGLVNNDQENVLGTLSYTGNSQQAVDAGTYTITPAVPGNNNYTVTYIAAQLTIRKAKQTITFNPVTGKNEGDPAFAIPASASSGLPVTYVSNNNTVISITGNTATIGAAGTVIITASQSGDNNYEAADPVSQTVEVTAYPVPDLTPDGAINFCDQSSVTLKGTAASPSVVPTWVWMKDGVRIPGATSSAYKVTTAGAYQVIANYKGQEKISGAITITVYPLPVVTIQASGPTTISKGETITLSSSGGGTYAWEPATGLSNVNGAVTNARPAQTTTYKVVVTSDQGCMADAAITINVKEDYKLESTNILTPNGDGHNDFWVVKNIDMYPDNEVKVFDRAGRLVFRQRNYSNTWNGTVNGSPLAEGTYYYIIDMGAGKPQFKGFITIVR
ncbi:MBG domain-containing protein [Chitinophaga sp. Cy-1792]|uniref:MBG domain-containing protein n=1 Tax=Chitinophaga sp. Cy-1792 TaxID=2608339 RepID=UPI00141D9269|nr:MBG domain-containing protein [Chitinophaga sp. Cy-1792]NIG54508.1 T9SS type B sorting domain-containing protein [Chitinophaga sp. Cy-1792]